MHHTPASLCDDILKNRLKRSAHIGIIRLKYGIFAVYIVKKLRYASALPQLFAFSTIKNSSISGALQFCSRTVFLVPEVGNPPLY